MREQAMNLKESKSGIWDDGREDKKGTDNMIIL